MNGTKAKGDIQRLRWKTKGADSAKGEIKCMIVIITCKEGKEIVELN